MSTGDSSMPYLLRDRWRRPATPAIHHGRPFSPQYQLSEAKVSVMSSRQTPGYELIRTATSNVQIYRVWSALRQLENAWVHGGPGDLEGHGQKRTNARVRVNLHPKVKCRGHVMLDQRAGGQTTPTSYASSCTLITCFLNSSGS